MQCSTTKMLRIATSLKISRQPFDLRNVTVAFTPRDIAPRPFANIQLAARPQGGLTVFSIFPPNSDSLKQPAIMPVPFETLIPYGIIVAMFGITGTGLAVVKGIQNGGKKPRYSLDQWDKNPLLERKARNFGIGQDIQPRRNLSRMVKWPEYVRLQRQKKILSMRLKVPPAIAQFQHVLDRNTAAQAFKLLNKYRPETKAEKKERLVKEATAVKDGKKKEDVSKKPYTVKYGLNHVVGLIENKKASLVLIPNDVDPIELVIFLPALCRKMGVPYAIIKGKARLGTVVHKKTAAVLAVTEVRSEDKSELSKLISAVKDGYLEKTEQSRKQWGGGIMGQKAQNAMAKKKKALEYFSIYAGFLPAPGGLQTPREACCLAISGQWPVAIHLSDILRTGLSTVTVWLECSDCRIPASNISGLHPNDVLTHRNVGNIISPLDISTSAVIEFAVAHLVVKHVVICGHSECSGIQSAMAFKRVGGTLDTWLAPLRAIRQQLSNELSYLQDDRAREMLIAEKNIECGVTALLANVTIQEHMASRNLQVHGYMLDAPSGRIRDLGLGPKLSTLTAIANPTHEIIRGNYAQLMFEEDGTATMTAK
ncbi:hypothetical protein BN1723_003116 [Verticillium longisporum]|uniref:carbonic anhydrase n=3 Tax=Verticillium longisporum TaxID=100787 RepID=A0A0G4LPK9_VERLO|nr:hypothetical protein BN1723_003116 [Verticillium longisporum]